MAVAMGDHQATTAPPAASHAGPPPQRGAARTNGRCDAPLKASRRDVDETRAKPIMPNESPDIHPRAPKPPQAGAKPTAQDERAHACAPDQLHVCFNCGGELVYPLDWCEEGVRHWRIALRCPECESRREGVFEQAAVELLDDELDRAAGALLGDLRRMTHANMSEEVDFFVRALDADLITPSDF
jgi:hypothetical protein